jgi:hypothetical protein
MFVAAEAVTVVWMAVLTAVPFDAVTLPGPGAMHGTVIVMLLAVVPVTVARTPLMYTRVPDVKPVPVTVAVPPTGIVPGATLVSSGAVPAAITVTCVEPLLPSIVAVICALPAATPSTIPAVETDATPVALELHDATLSAIGSPEPSSATAVSWTSSPTLRVGEAGSMRTLATVDGPVPSPPQAAPTTHVRLNSAVRIRNDATADASLGGQW